MAMHRLRPFLIVAVLLVTTPGSPRAEVASKSCSGLLPLAITPPAGSTGFDTGCATPTTFSPWPSAGAAGYDGVHFPACGAGECGDQIPKGNEAVRCLMRGGSACCIQAGDALHAASAGQLGTFRAALADRWAGDADQRDDICFATYTGNGQRVLLLPVTTSTPGPAGEVIVTDFVTAFLTSRPGNGARSDLRLEILPTLAVPVRPPTWGQLRTMYR